MKVCFYLSEMHSDKFLNAEMHIRMCMDQSPADVGWETENLQNTSLKRHLVDLKFVKM